MKRVFKRKNDPTRSEKIFDDVFKTFQQRMPQYVIPLINEAYNTEYPINIEFDEPRNEYVMEKIGKRTADSVLRLRGNKYHGEVQAYPDPNMDPRMMEYDTAIALDGIKKIGNKCIISFPRSFVLYIRSYKSTPDSFEYEIKSDGLTITRRVPIIKLMNYTLEDIDNKNLLIFLPYYIINYEKAIEKEYKKLSKVSEDTLGKIREDYIYINQILDKKTKDSGDVVKGRIYNMIDCVANHVMTRLKLSEEAKKEVKEAMGGQVLELEVDIAEARGEKRGEKRGKKLGAINKAEKVFCNMINHGYDIEEAIAISEIPRKRAEELLQKNKK